MLLAPESTVHSKEHDIHDYVGPAAYGLSVADVMVWLVAALSLTAPYAATMPCTQRCVHHPHHQVQMLHVMKSADWAAMPRAAWTTVLLTH